MNPRAGGAVVSAPDSVCRHHPRIESNLAPAMHDITTDQHELIACHQRAISYHKRAIDLERDLASEIRYLLAPLNESDSKGDPSGATQNVTLGAVVHRA